MKSRRIGRIAIMSTPVSVLGGGVLSAQERNTLKVPGGLGFAEFKGYEGWHFISLSQSDKLVAAILGNPVMIDAYQKGIPGNGQPVPDGAKMGEDPLDAQTEGDGSCAHNGGGGAA